MKNDVWARTTAHALWAVVFAMLGMSFIGFVSLTSLASQEAKARYQVTGRWQGKFPVQDGERLSAPDENRARQRAFQTMHGLSIVFRVTTLQPRQAPDT